ncbi:hypothetical protein [Actinospica robiniae]|nr:hypothetical protein [Actinospica robiniae]
MAVEDDLADVLEAPLDGLIAMDVQVAGGLHIYGWDLRASHGGSRRRFGD